MKPKPSVAELFQQYPVDPDDIPWYLSDKIDEAIDAAGEVHTQADPIDYLEELKRKDYGRALLARRALFLLPPEVVAKQLGTDIAVWAALTESTAGEANKVKANLEAEYGYHLGRLESARLWSWQRGSYSDSVKQILTDYQLSQTLHSSVLEDLDLPDILQNSANPDVVLSDQRIADYALIPTEIQHDRFSVEGHIDGWEQFNNEKTSYDAWLDTPSGFALTYRDKPQAVVGLVMNSQDEATVHQLQGVRAKRIDRTRPYKDQVVGRVSARGLMPLDWQRTMMTATERIAQHMGLSAVNIQSGENNVWIKPHLWKDKEPHMTIEQATSAYDTPAARLGYTRTDDKLRNWRKKL